MLVFAAAISIFDSISLHRLFFRSLCAKSPILVQLICFIPILLQNQHKIGRHYRILLLMRFAVPNCNLTVSIWIDWIGHQNGARCKKTSSNSNMLYISITRDAITNIEIVCKKHNSFIYHFLKPLLRLSPLSIAAWSFWIAHSNRAFFFSIFKRSNERKKGENAFTITTEHIPGNFSLHLNVCN